MTEKANFMENKMNKHIVSILFLVMALVGISNFTYAEKNGNSLEAHVHGLSELTIVMEGEIVEIQLTSPAMNLVGFEHKATSKKDIAAVENAASILLQHDTIFSFSGSDCKYLEATVDASTLIDQDDNGHDVHHHESHKDNHEPNKDEHHHGHKDHDEDQSHSEMVANYKYSCKDILKLSSIKLSVFKFFSGIYKVHAMWVMPEKQGSASLTAKNSTVEF
jgi:hypothetical protein